MLRIIKLCRLVQACGPESVSHIASCPSWDSLHKKRGKKKLARKLTFLTKNGFFPHVRFSLSQSIFEYFLKPRVVSILNTTTKHRTFLGFVDYMIKNDNVFSHIRYHFTNAKSKQLNIFSTCHLKMTFSSA